MIRFILNCGLFLLISVSCYSQILGCYVWIENSATTTTLRYVIDSQKDSMSFPQKLRWALSTYSQVQPSKQTFAIVIDGKLYLFDFRIKRIVNIPTSEPVFGLVNSKSKFGVFYFDSTCLKFWNQSNSQTSIIADLSKIAATKDLNNINFSIDETNHCIYASTPSSNDGKMKIVKYDFKGIIQNDFGEGDLPFYDQDSRCLYFRDNREMLVRTTDGKFLETVVAKKVYNYFVLSQSTIVYSEVKRENLKGAGIILDSVIMNSDSTKPIMKGVVVTAASE